MYMRSADKYMYHAYCYHLTTFPRFHLREWRFRRHNSNRSTRERKLFTDGSFLYADDVVDMAFWWIRISPRLINCHAIMLNGICTSIQRMQLCGMMAFLFLPLFAFLINTIIFKDTICIRIWMSRFFLFFQTSFFFHCFYIRHHHHHHHSHSRL